MEKARTFLKNITNSLFSRTSHLFTLFFLLIIALKWPFFSIPPVWDEAFSIFPAADFLVNHGFDYSLLPSQPRYHDGGPTAHSLSLITLTTALVLKITGGGTWAWVILHISQWLMAAAIGTMLTRIYSSLFDAIPAFLLAVATLVYPLMLAQFGGMYIEVPLLFFSLLAFYLYRKDRIWLASLSLVAACVTKESGVIAVGALALSALCGQKKTITKRLKNAFILTTPSVFVVLLLLIIVDMRLSFSTTHSFKEIANIIVFRNFDIYQSYISLIPEFIVILLGSLLLSVLWISKYIFQHPKYEREEAEIIIYNSSFILLFSIFHFVVHAYLQMTDSHFLTRYFFFVIPSMFLAIYYAIDKLITDSKIKVSLLLAIIVICLINRNGILYPPIQFSSIAMAERSEEYIDGYKVQKEYIRMIEKEIPENIPVYVNLPDYFLMHYPVSGYVQKPLANVHFIGHVLKSAENKFKYPDRFVLVYHYPWLGGDYIAKIIRDISNNKDFSFGILGSFSRGAFKAHVFEIKKRESRSP